MLLIDDSNFKFVRRSAQNWQKIPERVKQTVINRMLLYYRSRARQSEVFRMLVAYARENNFASKQTIGALGKMAAIGTGAGAGTMAGYHFGKNIMK